MRIYPLNQTGRNIWRASPIRIPGGKDCYNCDIPTVIVQSMDGGYVTRNCPRCHSSSSVPEKVFRSLPILVACPECGVHMQPRTLPDHNYGYVCDRCDVQIPLFELVPHYSELTWVDDAHVASSTYQSARTMPRSLDS